MSSSTLALPAALPCRGMGEQQVASQVCSSCVPGLANEKTVHICAGEDGGVRLSKSRPKHGNKPALFKHSTVAKKKNFRRTAANVGKDVHSFRPDLKVCLHFATCKPRCLFLQGVCVHLQDKLGAVRSISSLQPAKWYLQTCLFFPLQAAALARMSAVHRSQNAKAAADRKG